MSFSIYDDNVTVGEVISILPIVTSTLTASTSITTRQIISSFPSQVSIGYGASLLGSDSISIGLNSGGGSQSISIGESANASNSTFSISIGKQAGQFNTAGSNINIGYQAGYSSTTTQSVILGYQAGYTGLGGNNVAIGKQAGYSGLGGNGIAIGYESGYSGLGAVNGNPIAIGYQAGYSSQGSNSIAIGKQAGYSSQPANSIILNASGVALSPSTASSYYVDPIRSIDAAGVNILSWNSTTKEIYLNTSKTFIIDHPYQNDKYLVHGCLEGPEAGVYYRGQSEIVNNHSVEVSLPDYVKSFSEFTVQITGIYNDNNVLNYNSGQVEDGKFNVYGQNGKFFWLVHGMRLPIETEPLKSETDVRGDGPYKYIVPKQF
jgi:hypothetical protein